MGFIIAAEGRSGTRMLTTAINSHPDLTCYGEKVHLKEADQHPAKTGINLRYSKLDGGWPKRLKGYRIIHNVRRDLLAHAISHWVHKHQDLCQRPPHGVTTAMVDQAFVWHESDMVFLERARKAEAQLDKPPVRVEVDVEEIKVQMRRISKGVRLWYERLKGHALTVVYEDITKGVDTNQVPDEIAVQIADYLAVPAVTLMIPMRKSVCPDFASWIVNWDQVRRCCPRLVELHMKMEGG